MLQVQCPPVMDLVPLLSAPTIYLVLGTLTTPEDRAWLYRLTVRHGSPVTDALLAEVADALVFTWCGVPRWFAQRLWEEVLGRWVGFDGELAGRGVDVADLPAARATRLVWATLARWHGHDKDKGESWRRRIEAVPRSAVLTTPAQADTAADAAPFMALLAAHGRAR